MPSDQHDDLGWNKPIFYLREIELAMAIALSGKIVTFAVVALVAGLAVGFGASSSMLQPRITELEASEEVLQSRVSSLNSQVEELRSRESELVQARAEVQSLNAQIRDLDIQRQDLSESLAKADEALGAVGHELAAKRIELEKALDKVKTTEVQRQRLQDNMKSISETLSKFQSDRLILVELRKEVPTTRAEAIEFWTNLRSIAISSDPSLGPSVERVISKLGPYYNWLEARPEPDANQDGLLDEAFVQWAFFPPLGTFDYFTEIGKFQRDALLVIIVRMDAALGLVG